jgi:hypothetical protein
MAFRPFGAGDTSSALRTHLEQIVREIGNLDNEYVLKASPTELEQHYCSKVFVDSLALQAEARYINRQYAATVTISDYGNRAPQNATAVEIAVPYTGDKELWQLQPSSFNTGGYPEIEVREDVILFTHKFADQSADAEDISRRIQRDLDSLVRAVASSSQDVANHNQAAPVEVRRALAAKRAVAERATNALAALNIPMKRRDQPLTYTVPAKRRPSPVSRPAVATEKYAPEPVLAVEEFDFILRVCRSMALVMERDPASFASLDEPSIRAQFLLHLNGHYEGMATGETFNGVGKTDILIRIQDRNVFVAECKFWRGSKSFDEAIDQLLGYLTWRDSKCALLIFNQTKGSTNVRAKMHEIMCGRVEYRKTTAEPTETVDPRYVFVKKTDPGREVQICTMLFDVPCEASGSG